MTSGTNERNFEIVHFNELVICYIEFIVILCDCCSFLTKGVRRQLMFSIPSVYGEKIDGCLVLCLFFTKVFFRVFGYLSTPLTGATAGGWKPTHRIITRRRAGIFLTTETELSCSLNLVTRLNKTVYDLIYLLLNLQTEMNTHPPALLDCFLFSHAHDFIHNTSTAVSAMVVVVCNSSCP